ncbi:MAG: hypothetical protein KAI73_10090 [Rhodospirillaceae bacterium]|nr:hypothetical protein [Rhodospirillaceae bacterium]
MKQIFKSLLILALIAPAALLTQACASKPPAPEIPQLGFSHLQPIGLKVGRINISSTYSSPMKAPNVEHRFPTSPEKAARLWAHQRLRALGGNGEARFIVTRASVLEIPQDKKETGFLGAFTPEPTADYQATLKIRLEVDAIPGKTEGVLNANAQRSVLIHEDVSLAEREQIWFEMIETLMADLDVEMERRIRSDLGAWVE